MSRFLCYNPLVKGSLLGIRFYFIKQHLVQPVRTQFPLMYHPVELTLNPLLFLSTKRISNDTLIPNGRMGLD